MTKVENLSSFECVKSLPERQYMGEQFWDLPNWDIYNVNGFQNETLFFHTLDCWGNSLRSIPFVMPGHSIFNFFQMLGTPIFNTNPNNGCPNRIYQHSGQAHKHFSHRFHGVSFLADVQTWRSIPKFDFIATNPPQYQNFCVECHVWTSAKNDTPWKRWEKC